MRIDVISVFVDYLQPLHLSLIGKAIDRGVLGVEVHDLRDHTHDRHRTVDDTGYGGGPGMVMTPVVWGEAIDAVRRPESTLIIPTPSGSRFTQSVAADLSNRAHLIFACGRYEGIDSRVAAHYREHMPVHELTIGDYVLAGGEVAALVMIEAIGRLLPEVLGNPESATDDSFSVDGNLVEGPVYTRPVSWRGLDVPDVLLSGDHARIRRWRHEQAVARTAQFRPDLLR